MPDVLPVRTTHRDAQRTYDRLSALYDRTEGIFERAAIRRAVALAGAQPGERVLEIGPGAGRAIARFAGEVGPAGLPCAVDISPGMLAQTRARTAGRAVLLLGDATVLPLADDRFDLVFMSFILELLPTDDIGRALHEILRVLRPGGRLVSLSLSRESPNPMMRLYERGHALFPRLLDCRPIYASRSTAEAGFQLDVVHHIGVWGMPAEIVLAHRPGPPA